MSVPTSIERVWRRVQHLFQVGHTTTEAVDSGNVQTVQVKTHPAITRDAVPVVHHFGFSSSMPAGSNVAILNVAGDNSNGVIVGTAHADSRPRGLTAGQSVVYDAAGSTITLDGAGAITITPKGGTVTINGKLVVTGDATIDGIDFATHVHSGVEAGTANTGAPVT